MKTVKELFVLVERYASACVQDELAGQRDAGHATLKRHYEAMRSARVALEAELSALVAKAVS
jgi:hypothetical protein